MVEGDKSYYGGKVLTEFAPNLPFRDLDFSDPCLADWFYERIMSFYLQPAKLTADRGFAFAAGLLSVASIDALSRLARDEPSTRQRFVMWITSELPSFKDQTLAEQFYLDFRNGLVHECRVKSGGRFSLDTQPQCVVMKSNALSINVKYLIMEVEAALERFIAILRANTEELRKLSLVLRREFSGDLSIAKQEQNSDATLAPNHALHRSAGLAPSRR